MIARKSPELTIHNAIADHLRLLAPKSCLWFHIPNGESRSARTGAKLKRMGVRKGAPDFMVMYHGRVIWLEVKAEGKYPSKEQRAFRDLAEAAGGIYCVVRSSAEAMGALEGNGVPMREVRSRALPSQYREAAE